MLTIEAVPDTSLRRIQAEYLATEMESMEVFDSRRAVRFTTFKHKVPILLQLLQDDIVLIERDTIGLKDLFPNDANANTNRLKRWLRSSALVEVGRITSTSITRSSDNQVLYTFFT
jgi:hypothetical protein